jgi:hypothetical protein
MEFFQQFWTDIRLEEGGWKGTGLRQSGEVETVVGLCQGFLSFRLVCTALGSESDAPS